VIFISALGAVSAIDFYVDPTTGNNANNGTDPSAPKQTIVNATGNTSASVVNLAPGTYNATGDVNITLSHNMTIQGTGPGVVIDALNNGHMFVMNAQGLSITFINITFINANSTGDGGAIYITGTNSHITFINCTFENNVAAGTGDQMGGGGAIYSGGANTIVTMLDIINCTFIGNSGPNGGAVNHEGIGYTNVSGSVFMNNAANFGGAIYKSSSGTASSGTLIIDNSRFYANDADGNETSANGGAVYQQNGVATVSNSNFTSDRADGLNGSDNGAAIHNHNGNMTVINCNFNNNTALAGDGGALRNFGATANMVVINCNFTNNTAFYGGAIYSDGNSLFVTGSNFFYNSAVDNGTAGGYGGAIFANSNTTITNSTLLNNTASFNGGALFNNGVLANITYCRIVDNSATAVFNNYTNRSALTAELNWWGINFPNETSFMGFNVSAWYQMQVSANPDGVWKYRINQSENDDEFFTDLANNTLAYKLTTNIDVDNNPMLLPYFLVTVTLPNNTVVSADFRNYSVSFNVTLKSIESSVIKASCDHEVLVIGIVGGNIPAEGGDEPGPEPPAPVPPGPNPDPNPQPNPNPGPNPNPQPNPSNNPHTANAAMKGTGMPIVLVILVLLLSLGLITRKKQS